MARMIEYDGVWIEDVELRDFARQITVSREKLQSRGWRFCGSYASKGRYIVTGKGDRQIIRLKHSIQVR